MNITKLKKQTSILIICAIAALTGFLIFTLASVFSFKASDFTPASFLYSIPFAVFAVLSISHAFLLLHSVVKNESPFTAQNVRHLQRIGWLFVAYEPVSYLCQALSNHYFPISIGNGIWMTTTESYNGVFIICGFVILTVSTIFRYGMELQQLSDETL